MAKSLGVVVATYNGEQYLETQLLSIISQTIKPDLIVVSDGGSTDNSVDIARRVLSKGDIPYKLLESEVQLSVTNNFEKALRECDTDLIFFSDQDDKWLDNKIEITLKYFTENCSLVFSNAFITDEELQFNGMTLWNQIGFHPGEKIKYYCRGDLGFLTELIKHNVVTGMCMCITEELKTASIPFPDDVIHDYWLALLGITYGSIIAIDEPLTLYRQHHNNVVGTSTTIRKSFSKRHHYIKKIIGNKTMIEQLLVLNCNYENEDIKRLLKDYDDYLNQRIQYVSCSKLSNIGVIPKGYSLFEYNKERVIARDIYTRVSTIIKRGRRNELLT